MADEDTIAFATTDDLIARWHTLTSEESARAKALLDDASQLIRDTCSRWEEASPATRKAIACAMVNRAMLSDGSGVSNTSQTVGSFSESFTYANPSGDLYLTKSEKERLGVGVQRLWSVDLSDGSAE